MVPALYPRSVFGKEGAMMAGLGRQPLRVFLQSQSLIASAGNRPLWLWRPDGMDKKGQQPLRSVLYVCPSVEHVEVRPIPRQCTNNGSRPTSLSTPPCDTRLSRRRTRLAVS